jgi:hypothetical protein
VDLDGHPFVVDLGARFFHPGPYPLYTALLTALELHPPEATDTGRRWQLFVPWDRA